MPSTPPKRSKVVESAEYSLFVQLLAFGLFWLLPTIWMTYLCRTLFHIPVNEVALWVGMIILNIATYAHHRLTSATVNSWILHLLVFLQVLTWVVR